MPLTEDDLRSMTYQEKQLLLRELEARKRAKVSTVSAKRYLHDPVGFALECINWPNEPDGTPGGLTPYQQEILSQLPKGKHRVSARGPHGLGKSTMAAITVLWFALTRDAAGIDFKCVTTAGAWRQLEKYLWPEIHKWARLLNYEKLGRPPLDTRTELLGLTLKLKHGSAFAVASDTPELIEGAHADSVLYVYDESKSIIAKTFEAAEGAFSGARSVGLPEAYALAISTPGEPSGTFYDIHSRARGFDDWWVRHVTLAEAMAAGRISEEWRAQRAAQWGVTSAVYQNRVEGEFASSDEDGVIPLGWVELANERYRAWQESGKFTDGMHTVGVDVARTGEDVTVLALRKGSLVTELRKYRKEDTMETTGHVKGVLDADPTCQAVVDVVGIGAGVVDRLREQKCKVDGFNAGAGTKRKDKARELGFANCRSAGWWNLRELLDPASGEDVALPVDNDLTGDLTALHWKVTSGGKIQVESKDDVRKRLSRSTDCGDAVMQAFWPRGSNWASAYGVHTCANCRRPFMLEHNPQRCPGCRVEHGVTPAEPDED